ncbi:MAG: hypothetical protein AAFY34_16455 [Pseudomonadota bacterium]
MRRVLFVALLMIVLTTGVITAQPNDQSQKLLGAFSTLEFPDSNLNEFARELELARKDGAFYAETVVAPTIIEMNRALTIAAQYGSGPPTDGYTQGVAHMCGTLLFVASEQGIPNGEDGVSNAQSFVMKGLEKAADKNQMIQLANAARSAGNITEARDWTDIANTLMTAPQFYAAHVIGIEQMQLEPIDWANGLGADGLSFCEGEKERL